VPFVQVLAQDVDQAGSEPLGGVSGEAEVPRDLVAGAEAETAHLIGQAVGVGAHYFPRLRAVLAVERLRLVWGKPGHPLQLDHQLVAALVFGPGFTDGARPHRADAGNLLQPITTLLQDVIGLLTKVGHQGVRVVRAQPPDRGAGQVALDSRDARRRLGQSSFHGHLQAVAGVATPRAPHPVALADAGPAKLPDRGKARRGLPISRNQVHHRVAGVLIQEGDALDRVDPVQRLAVVPCRCCAHARP